PGPAQDLPPFDERARGGRSARRRPDGARPRRLRPGRRRYADHDHRRAGELRRRLRPVGQLRPHQTMNDPILTSVIANRLKAIGERMGLVVERSARSPLLVEGRDFSLGIYSHDGVLLEQTEYIPVLGYATA